MLDVFKPKPFDLQPIFSSWKQPPMFMGNPKKDPPVQDWLDSIKAGCIERQIPEEYWYKVGKEYLGPTASSRFSELKAVITKMNGGKYRWTWKKFKTAMLNMGWEIDASETETIKLESKPSGFVWWIGKKDVSACNSPVVETNKSTTTTRPALSKVAKTDTIITTNIPNDSQTARRSPVRSKTLDSSSLWLKRTATKKEPVDSQPDHDDEPPKNPGLTRSATITEAAFWTSLVKKDKEPAASGEVVPRKLQHGKRASEPDLSREITEIQTPGVSGELGHVAGQGDITTVANAPKWLVEACSALDFLTGEHPKVLGFVSAMLITAGSIPAIPAVAAGAGGAFLASGTAHAIGAVAVGLGNWLHAAQAGQLKTSEGESAKPSTN